MLSYLIMSLLSCITCMLSYVYMLMGHMAYCVNKLLPYLLLNKEDDSGHLLWCCSESQRVMGIIQTRTQINKNISYQHTYFFQRWNRAVWPKLLFHLFFHSCLICQNIDIQHHNKKWTFAYSRARACCACSRCGTGGLYFIYFSSIFPF